MERYSFSGNHNSVTKKIGEESFNHEEIGLLVGNSGVGVLGFGNRTCGGCLWGPT